MIELPGADVFKGELLHSSQYSDGDEFRGKTCRGHRRGEFGP